MSQNSQEEPTYIALVDILQSKKFKLYAVNGLTDYDTGAEHSNELWFNKKLGLAVELSETHNIVVVSRAQQNPDLTFQKHVLCAPNRLFFRQPDILAMYLDEVAGVRVSAVESDKVKKILEASTQSAEV